MTGAECGIELQIVAGCGTEKRTYLKNLIVEAAQICDSKVVHRKIQCLIRTNEKTNVTPCRVICTMGIFFLDILK